MVSRYADSDADLRASHVTWLLNGTKLPNVILAAGLAGLVAGLVRGQTAPMPSLSLGTLAPIPVVAVVALVPAIAVVWGWSNLGWLAAAATSRSVVVLVGPVVTGALVPFICAAWVSGGVGSALENGRNAVGLLGLSLVGVRLLGERGAAMFPISYLFLSFLFGRTPGDPAPRWWAWILSEGGSGMALIFATALVVAGAMAVPGIPIAAVRRGAG